MAWRLLIWKVLGAILVILTAVSQFYFFSSRLSVEPGATLKASDPFTTIFTLHNEGQFSVYDVQFECSIDEVLYPNNITAQDNVVTTDAFDIPELASNAKTSSPCYFPIEVSFDIITVTVSLRISYRPSFYPLRRTETFTFTGKPKTDGGYAWIPLAR